MRVVLLFYFIVSNLSSMLGQSNVSDIDASSAQNVYELIARVKILETSNRDSAEALLQIAEGRLSVDQSDSLQLLFSYSKASFHTENQEFEIALPYLREAIKLSEASTNLPLKSKTYLTFGNYYLYQRNYLEAYQFFQKSLDVEEQIGDPLPLAKSYANMSKVLRRIRKDQESLHLNKQALAIFKKEKDYESQINTLLSLCSAFGYEDFQFYSLDSAIYFGKQARSIAQTAENKFGEAKANSALASALIRKGYVAPAFLKEGLTAAKDAYQYFEKTSFRWDKYVSLLNQGYALEALDQPEEAITIANQVKAANFGVYECDRLLSRSYKRMGQFAKALSYHEKFHDQLDSITRVSQRNKLIELETAYQSDKKDSRIKDLSQQAEIQALQIAQQRNFVLGISILAVLLLIAGISFYRQRKLKQEQRLTQTEQRLLRAQMNPHFIFNALASIQKYVLQKEPIQAVSFLASFGKLMRQILEHSREEYIPLSEEKAMLENYLQIQILRFTNVSYKIHLDEELEEQISIPPMLAQPFIENALEHGMTQQEQEGKIDIAFEKKNELIAITIKDNGPGLKSKKQNQHKSLATKITKERLALYAKDAKANLSVEISDLVEDSFSPTGTKVSMLVPYK